MHGAVMPSEWIAHVRSGEYQKYHDQNYTHRKQELAAMKPAEVSK